MTNAPGRRPEGLDPLGRPSPEMEAALGNGVLTVKLMLVSLSGIGSAILMASASPSGTPWIAITGMGIGGAALPFLFWPWLNPWLRRFLHRNARSRNPGTIDYLALQCATGLTLLIAGVGMLAILTLTGRLWPERDPPVLMLMGVVTGAFGWAQLRSRRHYARDRARRLRKKRRKLPPGQERARLRLPGSMG